MTLGLLAPALTGCTTARWGLDCADTDGSYFDEGTATVTPAPDIEVDNGDGTPSIRPFAPVTSLAALLNQVAEIDRYNRYDDNSDAPDYARVRIIKSDDNGTVRWIVAIPSTWPWMPERNLQTNSTCLAAAGNLNAVLETGVEEAMRQAGVHDEDPVMLTGFSLGATTALRLSRYAGSRAVLVAGPTVSSYGSLDASTLSIVHRDDDFTKRPWDLDLATPVVSITVPVFTTENGEIVESKNLTTTEIHGAPHDIYTYAASAAQAETSDNRYAAGFMKTARPFFDGVQTMTDYQVKKAT